jgi:hypothetical protein
LLLVRRHPLDIAAVISLAALGILLCGYVAGFTVLYSKKTGPVSVYVAAGRGSCAAAWGSGGVRASQSDRPLLGSLNINTYFA